MTQHKTSNDLTWEELKAFKQHLDNKSPTFCLAKWYQTTLSLHSGYSASCCLQSPKKLNPEEVEQRPSRLHNSREHIQDRMQLLNGIKIPECQVCWDAESQGNSSERSFKSADHWAKDNKDRAPNEIENPTPTYVEVSFSKECQMRCSYCNPDTSSSLAKEFHEHGYYPDSETQKSLSEQESHIYIKAFWKWLPDIYPNLRVLRLTGGEPFLSEETFRFLDYIREHPNKWMNIEFNTNLSFPTTILHRFFKAFEKIPKNHYREVTLYISTDCWGPEAEYIRFGMKTAIIEANIQKLMATFDHINITITSTVSALAVFSFFDLVRKIEEWKGKWGEKTVQLSAYPLIYPAFQSVEILGKQGLSYFKKIESYVTLSEVFSPREKNMISVIRKRCERELSKAKKYEYLENFYRFFHEYDQRKKTHLTQLFPSLKRIFDEGKEIAQQNEKRWRADILGTHPDKAFKAYQELIRVNPHSEENQMALVTGSFWGKALDKESICRPGPFQEKTLIFLAQSLLDPNKLKDVFYTLLVRNPTTKELRRCFLLSIDYIDEKHHHCFYIWQKVALEFSVDKRDWSEINVTIYKKLFHKGYPSLLEHFLSSLLSSPSPHPSLKRVLNDKEMIYAPLIFRETPLSQDLLLKVFSSKFNILAFNFDLFLQHIPPSIDIIQDLWNLAFEYKDKLDIFTKCLKPWKDSLKALPRDPQQGDPFVNARMILTLGLEKWATASLKNINDPLAINDLLMTWKDCGLCLDEKVFASLLVKKYKKNSIPYNWMNMAKKTVSKKIFWPFLLKIAPHGHFNGFLTLIKNTPSEFISDKHIMTLLKLSIKDLSKDDPRLWDITNLILTLQFKKNILLQWILSLKEKILFTNPSDSPFYRIFLHLTKNNRSFFIDSLKNHSKDDIFKALYLRDEFFGSKEMWNLKELYDLSLLEPSILNGSLLTFDGQKDVQTIAKIALSDHIHKFCTFFLEGHQNIFWDILLEMAKRQTSNYENSSMWSIANYVIDHKLDGEEFLSILFSLPQEEKAFFTNPNDSPFYRIFLYLTKNNRSFFIDSLKSCSKDEIFNALYLRNDFLGSKEMWNLKELYDLSLLEPSVLAGHLLKFDGKEDIQILSKISLNKVSYHFFPYLITMGYSDMALVLMIKSMTTLPKDHSILWSLVSLAIKKNLRTKESLQAIYALDKPLRTRFLTPSRSATFTFFIYLKEETDRDLTAYLKGLSRNDYFTCLTLRKSIIEKNRTHQQYL